MPHPRLSELGRYAPGLGPTPLVPVRLDEGDPFAAAVESARRSGGEARVVTVFPDRMERDFSTELFAGSKGS